MNDAMLTTSPEAPVEAVLRDELARADIVLGTISPVLGHLLANHDHSLFSDEIVTRVRAMVGTIAKALLAGRGDEQFPADGLGASTDEEDRLAAALLTDDRLVAHCHALAVEWQLTARLEARNAIDPVLSPLLQALVASDDPATAATAMAALAAQARFVQQQRRMELPIGELPADLFHRVLETARDRLGAESEATAAHLREGYDESANRLGLLARLVHGMGAGALAALSIGHAGVALFLTALGAGSQLDRDVAAVATNDRQLPRLALALRAAGLKPKAVEEQFLYLHPDIALPEGFDDLRADRAIALLEAARRSTVE